MIIHEFDPVIFPVKLWILENPSVKKIKENFIPLDKNFFVPNEFSEDGIAYTSRISKNTYSNKYGVWICILRKKDMKDGDYAHEACHAVNEIYNYVGADNIDLGGEPHAYFVGWVADCIYEVVKTTNKKSIDKMAKKTTKTMPKKGTGKKC
jgi:hypothetical protein